MNKTISMLLVFIIIFGGCTHIIENSTDPTDIPVIFEEMTFRRNDDYGRTFKMMYGESNGISIGFLKDLYEKEEMLTTANLIKEDIKLLVSTLDIDEAEEIKIYVLEKTIAGGSYSKNNNVFCSKEDLINGNYRLSLIQSYLNLSEPWMMYGIHGKVFEKDADNAKLNDFYTNNDDISILGLFGARFYDEWNTKEEISIAQETAISLTEYVLENYDLDTLIYNVTPQIKNEWLKSIGVDREFEYIYEDIFNGFTFTHSKDYPLIITIQDACYNLIYLKDSLETTTDIEEFIYKDITGREFILNYFIESAPVNFDMVNTDVFYRYYIGDYYSSHSSERGEIKLDNHIDVHLHEAVHSMIRPNIDWTFEGIAEYLDLIAFKYNYRREHAFSFFQNIANGKEYEDIDNDMQVFEHYKNHGGKFESLEDIDMRLYCDASAYVNLSTGWGFLSERLPIYQVKNTNEAARVPGDELTYIQACSFIAFLVDNYSFDEFLSFCKTRSEYETIFDKTYDELKSDWIKYLER